MPQSLVEKEIRQVSKETLAMLDDFNAIANMMCSGAGDIEEIPINELQKLTIKNKRGRLELFTLNDSQRMMLDEINKAIREKEPVRQILLKIRQFGGSTFYTAVLYYLVKKYGVNAVIIGHRESASQNLFDKVWRYYQYDSDFKNAVERPTKNRKELRLPGGGYVTVHTAGGEDSATSQTNQIILATEQALWKQDPASQMRSLLNTVDDVFGTFVFIESTARGVGNDYQMRWAAAEKANTVIGYVPKAAQNVIVKDEPAIMDTSYLDYKPIFVGWMSHPDCIRPFKSTDARQRFINSIGTIFDSPDDNTTERTYWELGAAPERINWWRQTLFSKHAGIVKDMQQENPATPEEAFLSTGTQLFNHWKINRQLRMAKAPLFEGDINWGCKDAYWETATKDEASLKLHFMRMSGGHFKVWEWPLADTNYSIGGDVAEGISCIKRGREQNDDSAACIRNRETGKIAATWVGKIPPEDFGDILYRLHLLYNKAVVCVEANSIGNNTIARLKTLIQKRYLFRMSDYRAGAWNYSDERFGWIQNQRTKPMLLAEIAYEFRSDALEIHDKGLLLEMSELQSDPVTGHYETTGKDILIAFCLQHMAHLSMRKQVFEEKKEKVISFDEFVQEWREGARRDVAVQRMFYNGGNRR